MSHLMSHPQFPTVDKTEAINLFFISIFCKRWGLAINLWQHIQSHHVQIFDPSSVDLSFLHTTITMNSRVVKMIKKGANSVCVLSETSSKLQQFFDRCDLPDDTNLTALDLAIILDLKQPVHKDHRYKNFAQFYYAATQSRSTQFMEIYTEHLVSPFFYVTYANADIDEQFKWAKEIIEAAPPGNEDLFLSDVFLIEILRMYLITDCTEEVLDVLKPWIEGEAHKFQFNNWICTPFLWQRINICEGKDGKIKETLEQICLPQNSNTTARSINAGHSPKHTIANRAKTKHVNPPKLIERLSPPLPPPQQQHFEQQAKGIKIPSVLVLQPKPDGMDEEEYIDQLQPIFDEAKEAVVVFSTPHHNEQLNKSIPALPPLISIPYHNVKNVAEVVGDGRFITFKIIVSHLSIDKWRELGNKKKVNTKQREDALKRKRMSNIIVRNMRSRCSSSRCSYYFSEAGSKISGNAPCVYFNRRSGFTRVGGSEYLLPLFHCSDCQSRSGTAGSVSNKRPRSDESFSPLKSTPSSL